MKHVYDDGGRAAAGYRGTAGDCGCRAIAIATGLSYQFVYDKLNELTFYERRSRKSKARDGLWVETAHRFFRSIGWKWTPTMGIGTGCKVHMQADELPSGPVVVRLSRHYAAVIDGVLHDTYDSSRDEVRCVYGYWQPGTIVKEHYKLKLA